ncbi:MAG: tRNA guanosine(34) transglycosylase Tgt [Candidatus Aenigmarchaeota archaeon]|nr:tRNA guanosine(34) transglycosylase Tgt [Candidatus Aenigmarchaeota archaeon]
MPDFDFEIKQQDENCLARVGVIKTKHGKIQTPAFLPVATNASVKALTADDMVCLKAEVLMANTYHLFLRPGLDVIESQGGLHKFMNWDLPLMTDSGGFQAFSLGMGAKHGVGKIAGDTKQAFSLKHAKVNDDGVLFYSHYDGSKVFLTPELSIHIQQILGSDIMLSFDECTSPLSSYNYNKIAMMRTHKWAERCLDARKTDQALYGIIQGGIFKDLREQSAKFICSLGFDGIAIGGSFGKNEMYNVLDWLSKIIPKEKPVHLLGIGTVEDFFNSVEKGIDSFDCVTPTRLARVGFAFIRPEEGGNVKNKFRVDIGRNEYKKDERPISEKCKCYTCKNFSRAYLRHLYVVKELSFYRLMSIHNLNFFLELMKDIRNAIKKCEFLELKKYWLN